MTNNLCIISSTYTSLQVVHAIWYHYYLRRLLLNRKSIDCAHYGGATLTISGILTIEFDCTPGIHFHSNFPFMALTYFYKPFLHISVKNSALSRVWGSPNSKIIALRHFSTPNHVKEPFLKIFQKF